MWIGTNNFESIGEGNMPKSPNKLNDESSLVADAKQREKERAATNRLVLEFLLKPRNLF